LLLPSLWMNRPRVMPPLPDEGPPNSIGPRHTAGNEEYALLRSRLATSRGVVTGEKMPPAMEGGTSHALAHLWAESGCLARRSVVMG
jgi:hypothetical protein